MIKILNQSFELLAILQNVESPLILEEINGAYDLSFKTVIDTEKSQYINYQNIIEIEDNYFNIVCYKKNRNSDNTTTIDVQCEHKSYDLLSEDNILEDGFTAYGTPNQIMTQLFQGIPFTVGTTQIITEDYISINEKTNKRAVLLALASVFGGEIQYNKFEVSLLIRRGADRGVRFMHRKNLINCSYIVDARQMVAGLPTVSVDVDVAELEFAGLPDEHYELGDTITVIDSDLGVNIPARIVKESHNPLERMQGNVNIANIIPDISDSIVKLKQTTVVKDTKYNGCKIGPVNGFECIRGDNKVRILHNATEGFVVQKGDGSGSNWTDIYYVDINGNQHMIDGYIELLRSDGKVKILIDPVNGNKIQKHNSTTQLWDDVNYQDVDGNTILKGFIIASKFFGETKDSAYVEIGNASGGNLADFKIYRGTGGGEHPVFSIYDDLSIIFLRVGLGDAPPSAILSSTGATTRPIGIWNCNEATFTGLEASGYATQAWANGQFQPTISGASGNFTTVDGKTVTVSNGIISSIA